MARPTRCLIVGIMIGGLAFLASCSASPPDFAPPQLDDGARADDAWDARSLNDGTIADDWWRDFGDDHLNALIGEALTKSPNLRAAAIRIDQAAARAGIAKADLLPSLRASASASRTKQAIPGILPGGGLLVSRSNSFGVDLTASWELDIWGKARAGRDAAFADFQATRAAFEAARLSLISQLTKAYLSAVEAGKNKALWADNLETGRRLEARIRERYEEGLVSQLELTQTVTQVERSAALVSVYERLYDNALRQIALFVGRYPKADGDVASELPALPSSMPEGLPATLVRRRPDLVEAERRLAAQTERIWVAESQLYPSISLTASGGTASDELSDLVDADFGVWSIAANITAPLFEGGRIRRNIELQEATAEELQINFVATALNAYLEVEQALANDGYIAEELLAYQRTVSESERALRLAEERYFQGLATILDVLTQRQAYYTARADLIVAQRMQLESRINLYVALGGGFEANDVVGKKPSDKHMNKSEALSRSETNESTDE